MPSGVGYVGSMTRQVFRLGQKGIFSHIQRGAHNGGRGMYFDDPDGHFLEVMTRPYQIGS